MFSKEEAVRLRKDFWTSFGKSFPRKWLLYNTKIKGFSFKFVADRKKALVSLDIENPDELVNLLYYDQLISLKTLLQNELPKIIFNSEYELENGKKIHRIYVLLKVILAFIIKTLGETASNFLNIQWRI